MTAHDQASEWIHRLASRGCTMSQDEMREMFEKGLVAPKSELRHIKRLQEQVKLLSECLADERR